MPYHSNFQLDDFPTPYLTTHIPKEADVIIVGGGLAGLLTLYYLTKYTKLSVYLLEEGALGFHASGRDIGSVHMLDWFLAKKLVDNPEAYKNYIHLLKSNQDELHKLITHEQIQCDYDKTGGFYVSSDAKESDFLINLNKTLSAIAPNVLWPARVDGIATMQLLGTSFFMDSLFIPNDSVFSTQKFLHGVAKVCEKNERRILTNCIVENITQSQEGINIQVRNRGMISTKNIVYCTGIYTGKVVPGVNKFLLARKQHVIVTEKVDKKLLDKLPRAGIVFNGIKLKVTDDRVMLQSLPLNLADRFYDGEINMRACDNMKKLMRLVYPELNKVDVEFLWSKITCTGVDGLPICGEIHNRPKEFINIGFGTSNLNCIMLCAAAIKDMIVGKSVPEQLTKLFDPRRVNNV